MEQHFTPSVFSLYVAVSITVCLDTGFYDRNFQNTLLSENAKKGVFAFFEQKITIEQALINKNGKKLLTY